MSPAGGVGCGVTAMVSGQAVAMAALVSVPAATGASVAERMPSGRKGGVPCTAGCEICRV
jgi:hypothetical protein